MAASLNDMAMLVGETGFSNRAASALWLFCGPTIRSETNNNHQARKSYAATILNNQNFYKPLFVAAVSVNQTVANDATASGSAVAFTGSITLAVLTIPSAPTSGAVVPGMTISGPTVAADTIVLPFGTNGTTGVGQAGTYAVSVSQTVASVAMTGGPTVLDATNVVACAKAIPDGDINNAIAAAFSDFIAGI